MRSRDAIASKKKKKRKSLLFLSLVQMVHAKVAGWSRMDGFEEMVHASDARTLGQISASGLSSLTFRVPHQPPSVGLLHVPVEVENLHHGAVRAHLG